jgi:hypothetical protein
MKQAVEGEVICSGSAESVPRDWMEHLHGRELSIAWKLWAILALAAGRSTGGCVMMGVSVVRVQA